MPRRDIEREVAVRVSRKPDGEFSVEIDRGHLRDPEPVYQIDVEAF